MLAEENDALKMQIQSMQTSQLDIAAATAGAMRAGV